MSAIFYKVIFKGTKQEESSETIDYSLTFKRIFSQKPINIHSRYLSTLRNLDESNDHIISFQNIQEVIKIGEGIEPYSFNYHIVILYKTHKEQKMEGFLIGNAQMGNTQLGDILVGVWPFNQDTNYTSELMLEKLDKLTENKDIETLSLIYS